MKAVGIVVVTYNRLSLLREVIDSLRNQTYRDCQIIVINNGSTDATLEWLNAQKDVITITQANLGGAGGFHAGMKYVAEHGYEYCWVMDDDVICAPTALEELVRAYHAKEGIGFVCSKVSGTDGCAMNTPRVDDAPEANGYANYYELSDHNMIKVVKATFVSVFLGTAIIYEVGLPYKEYFIWGDDMEYTTRISARHDCYVACNSKVMHKRKLQQNLSFGRETDPARLRNYFYAIRNTFNNYRPGASTMRLFLRYNKLVCRALKFLLKGQFAQFKIMAKALTAIPWFNPVIEFPHETRTQ